jgi:hypothetical protein
MGWCFFPSFFSNITFNAQCMRLWRALDALQHRVACCVAYYVSTGACVHQEYRGHSRRWRVRDLTRYCHALSRTAFVPLLCNARQWHTRDAFESISVWLLPPPVDATADLSKELNEDDLSPMFR